MSFSRGIRFLLAACAALAPALSVGQSFNIDLDVFFGPPSIGNGAPSAAFGAAANQPGYWNRVYAVGPTNPEPLFDLVGSATSVIMQASGGGTGTAIGYNNPDNTGDYALLQNDYADIAQQQVGIPQHITYDFTGMTNGHYRIFTYAASAYSQFNRTEVLIPGAMEPSSQIVTGPMAPMSFECLVTHAIHEVDVTSGTLQVRVNEIDLFGAVNGFQIVLVPEPSGILALSPLFAAATMLGRKRR